MPDSTNRPTEPQALDFGTALSPGQPQEVAVQPPTANTASGSQQAFRDIRRELAEADLANPGVQRLILNELDTALARIEVLTGFESRYHDRDKQAAVLEEKLKRRLAVDIAWTAGISLGVAFVTLAPVVWETPPTWVHTVFLAFGAILIVGGIAVRVVLP
jgi:hypothetical protein